MGDFIANHNTMAAAYLSRMRMLAYFSRMRMCRFYAYANSYDIRIRAYENVTNPLRPLYRHLLHSRNTLRILVFLTL